MSYCNGCGARGLNYWDMHGNQCAACSAALTVAQPAPAAPSEDRAEQWRKTALAFERRAMRVEAALRLALKELSDQSRSGYLTRAMDVLRAEAAPAAQPADSAMAEHVTVERRDLYDALSAALLDAITTDENMDDPAPLLSDAHYRAIKCMQQLLAGSPAKETPHAAEDK